MNFNQIEYFLKVAEEGSVIEGAEALGVSQPEVLEAIKALEEEWGWQLFVTQNSGLQLTEEGVVSYREMKTVQLTFQESMQIMKEENAREELRIGYAPSISALILKKAIDHYKKNFPSVKIRLHSVSTQKMREGIDAGDLDVIMGMEFISETIEWETLSKLPQNVVMKRGHSLAAHKELSPGDLDKQRLLMLTRSENPQYWSTILAFFSKKEINAKIAGEFDGIGNLIEALKAGLGVAILPDTIALEAEESLVVKPLSSGIPALKIGIGLNGKLKIPHVNAFINSCKRVTRTSSPDYELRKEPDEVRF